MHIFIKEPQRIEESRYIYTAFLCIETQNIITFWSVMRYIGKRNNFWMAYIYPLNYHMYFHFPYAPIYVQKLVALDAMPLCTYGTGNLSFIIKHQLSWQYFYIKEKQYISKTNITGFTWMDNLCDSNWSFSFFTFCFNLLKTKCIKLSWCHLS